MGGKHAGLLACPNSAYGSRIQAYLCKRYGKKINYERIHNMA
jgi:hypothetical protein